MDVVHIYSLQQTVWKNSDIMILSYKAGGGGLKKHSFILCNYISKWNHFFFFFQVGASLGMLLKSLHSKKLYRNWMHKSQLCKAGREHIPDREDTIRRCEGTWWATYNRMIIKRRLWARCSVCTVIPELRDWWLPQVWDQLGRPGELCLRTQHRHQTRWWRRLEMN